MHTPESGDAGVAHSICGLNVWTAGKAAWCLINMRHTWAPYAYKAL